MPFKRIGKTVYKQVRGRWIRHAEARSERNAAIMLRKLNRWMEMTEQRRIRRKPTSRTGKSG